MAGKKEELSWMDMLRQPAAAAPQPKNSVQSKPPTSPPASTSSKDMVASPGPSSEVNVRSRSSPSFSGVKHEPLPPVSVSQKVNTSVDPNASNRSPAPPSLGKSLAPAVSNNGAGQGSLDWIDALQVTSTPSKSAAGGAGGTQMNESWMEFLTTTNDNASMNWMEALRKPMPAPAAGPTDSTKTTQYIRQTISKSASKKEGVDLGTYFGVDSKRKVDDDSSEGRDEGSSISLSKKKSTTEPRVNRAAPLPEPQELREEGAVLVLENNIYVVRAATPEKLVETLTSEARSDLPFTNTFMLTFRAFMTPMTLFTLLMKRFYLPPPATTHPNELEHWRTRVCTPTRLRVFIVAKMWVTFHWMDFERDAELLAHMKELPRKLREAGMPSPAEMLAKLLEKKAQPVVGPTWGGGNELTLTAMPPPPKPVISLRDSSTRPDFARLPAEELARQLTLLEHDLFRVIPPWELLGLGWMKADKTMRAPNILANISRFNYVSQWVTSEVVSSATMKDCQACIENMIRLMEECYNLQNYCSTLEIISGLEQTPVWRLKEVWSNVNPKLRKSLEEKAKKFRSDKNWKKHRKLVQSAIPPCIPYLGMYLTDLVFADEVPKEREGYVNFDKYRILARIIHELQLHQRTLYNFEPVPALLNWWTSLRLLDENTAYERSYALIPRGGTQRAERRGSQALAIRQESTPTAPIVSPRVPSEHSPMVTYSMLRNLFPLVVKETILSLFPPEKFTFSSWRALDTHGLVYGWADEVETYLAQNATDTIVIHAATSATKSDIYAVEHQMRLYDISASDKRSISASIITLVTTADVLQVAEEKGIEIIIAKDLASPEGLEQMPSVYVDTLTKNVEPPVVSPRGAYSSLQQFFAPFNFGEDANTYTRVFQQECILPEDLPFLTMDILTEMGVKMGHAMKMMKIINQLPRD